MAGPGGREVGRLNVRVLPNTSSFGVSLQRYLDRVEARTRVRIRVLADTTHFDNAIRDRVLVWDRYRIRMGIRPDRDSFRAFRDDIDSEVGGHAATARVAARFEVGEAEIQRLRREMAAIRPPISIPATLDVDDSALRSTTSSLSALSGSSRGLVSTLPRLAAALASLGSATPAVAGLGASLAQMAPAAALLAPTVLALVTAGGALAIGFSGVDDALTGSKKALEELEPSAAHFVTTVRGLRDEWGELQNAVQSRLFEGWGDAVAEAADTVLPALRGGLEGTSAALNAMGLDLASTAGELAESGTLGAAIKGTNTGLQNMSTLPGSILDAFITLSAGAAPAFDRVTESLSRNVESMSRRLRDGLESGGLQEAIGTALDVAKQFWNVLKNVGNVLGNVLGPAADLGAGTLGTLEELTGMLDRLTSTEEAQQAFRDLFSVLQTVGQIVVSNLGALLGAALPLIGAIASALAGPLASAAEVIKPVFENVATALGDALTPAVEILSGVVADFVPVLADIMAMIGNDVIVPLLQSLEPLLTSVAQILADVLAPVLAVLPEAIQPIALAIGELAPIISEIIALLLEQLSPSLVSIAQSFADLLVVVGPYAAQAISSFGALLEWLMPFIAGVTSFIGDWADMCTYLVTGVLNALVIPVVEALTALLRGDFSGAWEYVQGIFQNFTRVIEDGTNRALDWIKGMVNDSISWLGDLASRGWEKITEFAGNMADGAADAAGRMVDAIEDGVNDAVGWIADLPSLALEELGDLSRYLYNSGRALVQGFIDGIKSMGNILKEAAGGILSGVRGLFPDSPAKEGPFSGRGWVLYSGRAVSEAFAQGMLDYRSLAAEAAGSVALGAYNPLNADLASPPENLGGLQPGDRIALTVDGQTTLDAVIQRGADSAIDRTLIAPARLGRR